MRHLRANDRRHPATRGLSIAASLVGWGVASFALSLTMWTMVPMLVGYQPHLVLTGSMQPRISTGDVVLTAPVGDEPIRVGQVILVKDTSRPDPYLHRVVAIDHGRFVTKGDANPTSDFPAVQPRAVSGVARIRIPWIGLPGLWARSNPLLALLACLCVVLAAKLSARPRRAQPRRRHVRPSAPGLLRSISQV